MSSPSVIRGMIQKLASFSFLGRMQPKYLLRMRQTKKMQTVSWRSVRYQTKVILNTRNWMKNPYLTTELLRVNALGKIRFFSKSNWYNESISDFRNLEKLIKEAKKMHLCVCPWLKEAGKRKNVEEAEPEAYSGIICSCKCLQRFAQMRHKHYYD